MRLHWQRAAFRVLLLAVSIFFWGAFHADAQTQFLIEGKVLDATRSAVAGAQVTAIEEGKDSGPSMVSDGKGEFSFALVPGRYTVRIVAKGFEDASEVIDLNRNI